ncbi:MAG: hypothetical protein K9M51_01540 [Candidatus Gracilibacteria bacterium]|nr:hypothetical protein [Candidatus Gracilibacteria bacterium]
MRKYFLVFSFFLFSSPLVWATELCPAGSHLTSAGETRDFSLKTSQLPTVLEKIRQIEKESSFLQNDWDSERQRYIDQINAKFDRSKSWLDQWLDTQKGRINSATGWASLVGDSHYSGVQNQYDLALQELRATRDEAIRNIKLPFETDHAAQTNRLKAAYLAKLPEYISCSCDVGKAYVNNRCVQDYSYFPSPVTSPLPTIKRDTRTPQERQWANRSRIRPTKRNRRSSRTIDYKKMLEMRQARRR